MDFDVVIVGAGPLVYQPLAGSSKKPMLLAKN